MFGTVRSWEEKVSVGIDHNAITCTQHCIESTVGGIIHH